MTPAAGSDPGTPSLRVAVLLSGTGRSFDNLLAEQRAGRLPIAIVGVISSREGVRGLERARAEQLPNLVLRRRDFGSAESYGAAIGAKLREWRADLVVMAGFLQLWTIPAEFAGRVINIHPALLPAFGGAGMHGEHVHEAVLRSGASTSGCTVHFADNEYDTGPVILQRSVPVQAGDTAAMLAQRVFAQEIVALPDAIRLFAAGRLRIEGRRVRILP